MGPSDSLTRLYRSRAYRTELVGRRIGSRLRRGCGPNVRFLATAVLSRRPTNSSSPMRGCPPSVGRRAPPTASKHASERCGDLPELVPRRTGRKSCQGDVGQYNEGEEVPGLGVRGIGGNDVEGLVKAWPSTERRTPAGSGEPESFRRPSHQPLSSPLAEICGSPAPSQACLPSGQRPRVDEMVHETLAPAPVPKVRPLEVGLPAVEHRHWQTWIHKVHRAPPSMPTPS